MIGLVALLVILAAIMSVAYDYRTTFTKWWEWFKV